MAGAGSGKKISRLRSSSTNFASGGEVKDKTTQMPKVVRLYTSLYIKGGRPMAYYQILDPRRGMHFDPAIGRLFNDVSYGQVFCVLWLD